MNSNIKERSGVQSPHTAQNVDAAIAHLERILSLEGSHSLFGQTYWRARVMQVCATRGLMHGQRTRLQRLLGLLADAASTSPPQSSSYKSPGQDGYMASLDGLRHSEQVGQATTVRVATHLSRANVA